MRHIYLSYLNYLKLPLYLIIQFIKTNLSYCLIIKEDIYSPKFKDIFYVCLYDLIITCTNCLLEINRKTNIPFLLSTHVVYFIYVYTILVTTLLSRSKNLTILLTRENSSREIGGIRNTHTSLKIKSSSVEKSQITSIGRLVSVYLKAKFGTILSVTISVRDHRSHLSLNLKIKHTEGYFSVSHYAEDFLVRLGRISAGLTSLLDHYLPSSGLISSGFRELSSLCL